MPSTTGSRALLQPWALSLIADLEERIRSLLRTQEDAYAQVRLHRSLGQLAPGSLTQEIADNDLALRQALERYRQVTGSWA